MIFFFFIYPMPDYGRASHIQGSPLRLESCQSYMTNWVQTAGLE